jgi:hypothetical protein
LNTEFYGLDFEFLLEDLLQLFSSRICNRVRGCTLINSIKQNTQINFSNGFGSPQFDGYFFGSQISNIIESFYRIISEGKR